MSNKNSIDTKEEIECPKCFHTAHRTAGSSRPDMGFIKGWFCSHCGGFVREKPDKETNQ